MDLAQHYVPRDQGDDITDWVYGFFYQMAAGLVFVRGEEATREMLNIVVDAAAEDEDKTRQ